MNQFIDDAGEHAHQAATKEAPDEGRWVGVIAVLSVCPAVVGSTTVSASTPDAVLTLRIGTDDVPGRPAADQIEAFARAVAEHGDGSIVVEPVWHAAGDTADWDQQVARLVTSGELEMGLIPARAWDTEGVTTLRALNTPFLVTTEALVDEIVSDDDLAGELMSGLDEAGVVGLALFPEGLRHPFALSATRCSVPPTIQGAVMRAPTSATTAAMFEALGATTNDDEPDPSTHAGVESSYLLAPPGTATGNVTFFPKVNSLVINADVWAGLTRGAAGDPHRAPPPTPVTGRSTTSRRTTTPRLNAAPTGSRSCWRPTTTSPGWPRRRHPSSPNSVRTRPPPR